VIRVLVVDDQTLVREGLVSILDLLPGVEVAGAAADGEEAVRLAAEVRPDVVLMDLRMPRLDGVEATRQIGAAQPEVAVLVLTTYADDASIVAALEAGARGYLTKDAGAEQLRTAIEAVHAGQALLDPSVQRRLLARLRSGTSADRASRPGQADALTPREREVLRLMAEGLGNEEIAERLVVSEATVKTHVNNLFAKIGARGRAQAVAYAFRNGLVP
jgi:DNA-binding NarL/FixJ family response regulator